MIKVIYETFDHNVHDVSKVAKLVYDVDFRTFDMLFKTPESAVKAIARDLPKRGLGDYYKVILDDDGEIIGVLMVYNARVSHRFYLKSPKLLIVDILDHFALADIEDDDLYLAEIAIDSELRGRGIGRKLCVMLLTMPDLKIIKGSQSMPILEITAPKDSMKK